MKVFLALTASSQYPLIPHFLKYPFRLCSYFYLRDEPPNVLDIHLETQHDDAEWIMDSGLFSYMFGGAKGQLKGYDDFKRYASEYVEKMHKWKWKHAIVECDAQRILGVDATERLRDEVFRQSGLEVIYVWHIPEGEDGLVRLAQREKRVALSIPEFRMVAGTGPISGTKVKMMVTRGLQLIRKAGTEPRVHLLGNTENKLVVMPADSCDSSTWTAAGRWGFGHIFDMEKRQLAQTSIYSPKWRAWREWCLENYEYAFTPLRKTYKTQAQHVYYDNAACSVIAMWLLMNKVNCSEESLITPASHAASTETST